MVFHRLIVLFLMVIFTGTQGTSTLAQADSLRFGGVGKEVVFDKKTGLSWQKGDSYLESKQGLSWYEAVEYVNRKNREKFGGHNDWRLPTLGELKDIWDSSRPLRSKDGEPIGLSSLFSGGGSYYLWTADERILDHA
ncbi:MAG: hypothetical protein A3K09_01415, partial [Nitrospinae bacterium RIFCSPLOWO2_12_FULL_47_7]